MFRISLTSDIPFPRAAQRAKDLVSRINFEDKVPQMSRGGAENNGKYAPERACLAN